MRGFSSGYWSGATLTKFIFPTEEIVYKGDIGVSQAAYGLDSGPKVHLQRELARVGETEPVDLERLQKKHNVLDTDLRSFIISYLDYWLSGSSQRIQPTDFGIVAGRALSDFKHEKVWDIFGFFKKADRIRIIDSLSTASAITRSELRRQMLFPGSLKHNLEVLSGARAVEMRGDRVSTGTQYRHYLETLDLIQNCFAEVRRQRKDVGISLKVSQIMTPGGFVTATLADNLAEVVSAMIFRGVNGIVIPAEEVGQYILIERGKALKAYAEGYGTRTIQSLPEELKSTPATATPDEPVSDLVDRMSKGGVEHAVVLDQKKLPKGIVSSKDVLSLLLYHARLPGGPPLAPAA